MKTTITKLPLLLTTCALTLLAAHPAAAQSACDRACLTGFVDAWFKGLVDNSAKGVPVAKDVKITQNGQATNVAGTFWDSADAVPYRWDIANARTGDTGSEAVIHNTDGTYTMLIVRLKVKNSAITEIETIKTNKGEADGLWGPEVLLQKGVSPGVQLSIREADRDSYYRLIAGAESYWRAFQTNGTPAYHPADLMPDTQRFENGLQTTGVIRDGNYASAPAGFDSGRFIGRNLWDRRYPVVDEERGIVLSMVRFGLKDGMKSQSVATSSSRVVGEFFAIKRGWIHEVHAVLFNVPETLPTFWPGEYSPPRGGAGW
ncbi:MAG TPA: hypothetical protein VMH83_08590 [Candidatus Acidoferrum sp.]|nr:hypothetical protein [Candidatus Acidoferrum sp.]